ncbi:hypothetical protein HZS61_002623 [Fusarium oxysporum f. sp. conglutinans]|uniref:Uncharacterized protein n=1 Tax=Fusarium oxysporum f. sp. conglutinans TaxID=100902 RepID=A0A8H6GJ88_FUSOX|nr:hypothetical protein HZS61_002623 [Fusarium oxysporum f. sp. conglutinans]
MLFLIFFVEGIDKQTTKKLGSIKSKYLPDRVERGSRRATLDRFSRYLLEYVVKREDEPGGLRGNKTLHCTGFIYCTLVFFATRRDRLGGWWDRFHHNRHILSRPFWYGLFTS